MRSTAFSLTLLFAVGCGGRHPATVQEQALGGSLVRSIQAFSASHAEGSVALPVGTAPLVSPLFGPSCVVGTEADAGGERLRFACNHVATEIRGDFSRAGDRYALDLAGDGVFDFSFTANLVARPGFLDGEIELSIERNLILTTIGLHTKLRFDALVLDASGCVSSGSLVASLEAEVPGENPDYAIDAVYGPGCGVMLVAD